MSSVSPANGSHPGWIVWKLKKADPAVASVRYRCLIPVLADEQLYRRSVIIEGDRSCDLDGVAALIFVKTFSSNDVELARAAAKRGVPIYFDLCDNIFSEGYGSNLQQGEQIRSAFLEIARLASGIVTNGPGLTRVLLEHLPPECQARLREQADPVETRELTARAISPSRWPNRAVAQRLAPEPWRGWAQSRWRTLAAAGRQTVGGLLGDWRLRGGALPLVLWFGNSSSKGGNEGLSALHECLPQLRQAHARVPFRLLVVSNDAALYRQLIAGQGVPSQFIAWSPLGVFAAMRRARVCLVPTNPTSFNRGKSPNRLLMAMAHGLPVIASSVEAYQPFADCVVLDDFAGGVLRYLDSEDARDRDLQTFRERHWPRYQPQKLSAEWMRRLSSPPGEF